MVSVLGVLYYTKSTLGYEFIYCSPGRCNVAQAVLITCMLSVSLDPGRARLRYKTGRAGLVFKSDDRVGGSCSEDNRLEIRY